MKNNMLKWITLLAGLAGAALMYLLYATGIDGKGLLIRGHWAGIGLWTLTLLTLALILLTCRRAAEVPASSSIPAAAGSILAAGIFGLEGIRLLSAAGSTLDLVLMALHFLSAAALVYEGICLLGRKNPSYLANTLVSLCFALRMVSRYRLWSSNPQLMDYGFYMLAHVCLMLAAYHLATRDAGMDQACRRKFFALSGAYFSIVCVCGGHDPLFMGITGLWALTRSSRQEG